MWLQQFWNCHGVPQEYHTLHFKTYIIFWTIQLNYAPPWSKISEIPVVAMMHGDQEEIFVGAMVTVPPHNMAFVKHDLMYLCSFSMYTFLTEKTS